MSRLTLNLSDPRVLDVLALVGIPYAFGAGEPKDGAGAWPPDPLPMGHGGGRGFDCSGLVIACLVRHKILSPTSPDRTAATLYGLSKPVSAEMAQFGDLAFYGQPANIRHVTLCLGGGLILGANGGGSLTYGDKPSAFVKIDRIAYREDFRGVRRLGP